MKLILVMLGLIGFAGYVLPGRIEVVATPCMALEARAGRLLGGGKLPTSPRAVDPGRMVGEVVRRNVPFLPPEIGCAAAYWLTVYQPDLGRLAAPGG